MIPSHLVALACFAFASLTARAAGLPFIQDDFAKARDEALKRNAPLFVECWAPW